MFIDWDSSRFHVSGPEFYIAYTTHLTDFMKPYRREIIAHVAKREGIEVSELTHRVRSYRRYTEVFDVNWAAMMMAKVADNQIDGDIEEFSKIALERIKVYEESKLSPST